MAALLESLLLEKVEICKARQWLKHIEDNDVLSFGDPEVTVHRQEFVAFFLHFLREQSSQALTHGPATPAKTPSCPRPAQSHGLSSERRGCRSTGGSTGVRSASRIQLFSPAPFVSPMSGGEWDAGQAGPHSLNGVTALISPSLSSAWSPASRPSGSERRSAQRVSLGDYIVSPPELQPSPSLHRGRKKSGGMGGQGRHTVGRGSGHQNEDAVRMEGSGWRGARVGGGHSKMNDQVSPPAALSVGQLNFNNLEDFPPVGALHTSPPVPKPSRRINPTPVSAERPHSKPKSCFTSTPFSKPSSPPSGPEAMVGSLTVGSPLSLQEERELLKMEKNKRTLQTCSHIAASVEPCTPTKSGLRPDSKVTPDTQTTSPEPSKVTFAFELDLLAVLYCTCISENLVPNVFLELFFVIQLLTSRSPPTSEEDEDTSICLVKPDVLEKGYLGRVHNCVYFAVRVLENQFPLVAHLDKCTLRLLAENERVACFSPKLRDHLTLAQETSAAKRSPSVATFIHSVPFQPATDNRSNFSSDKAFHTFKKQRDIFYELLREWEDFHKEPAWDFATALGGRIRGMVSLLTAAGNHSHFARLFLKQLVQMCKGPCTTRSSSDAPDADLLGMLGADSLGRLKRLEERLIQPQGLTGPCPPPSFPGHQEFFRDFLLAASCCQLNQHLKDSLCQQLLQLDEVSILGPVQVAGDQGNQEADGDMEQQDEKQRFSSVLLLARLLAKFLGFISFLPYQTSEKPSKELQEVALSLRSKSAPVLDVCGVLRSCVLRRRTVLTVPWLVEFLSMLDHTAPLLLCYRKALGMLLLLYRRMVLGKGGETCYLNQLLMVALLGWLFQIPVIPEDIFFTSDFTEVAELEESGTGTQGLDCLPLVDHQLLYTCCPFLGEFRKLLAAFVSGSTAKSGGIVRKITPTSAELKGTPPTSRSQQKLQVDLEQAFFHNQPPSLRRTVEFVAERVGSNCVKHMKATLVCELVQRGEKMLRDGLASSAFNAPKLNDSICAQLCDGGMQALERATRFCSEKGPEVLMVLLPVETAPAVLATSESITRRLATEKACSWLTGNITALIKREWKSTFDRVMKTVPIPDQGGVDGLGLGLGVATSEHPTTPKRKQGNEVIASCPVGCTHSALMPSDVLVEIKEVLNIAVGPRAEEELITVPQLTVLLERVAATLDCRKFLTPVSEQMLVRATVLLACKLVSGEVPLVLSQDDGVACDSGSGVGPGPGVDSCRRALLEQLVGLWERSCCFPAPLHLLFTELTISALLKTSGKEWNNYLFLVRRLVEKGLMGEDEMLSHWNRLSNLPLPMELMEKVQLQSGAANSPELLPELPSHMDMLQVSPLPVEGAT